MPSNKLPDVEVSFADKIFHSITYLVLTFLWFYSFFYRFKIERMKALIYASVIAVAFGIIIEVLQEILTETRSADLLDVLANSLGVFMAACSLLLKKQKLS